MIGFYFLDEDPFEEKKEDKEKEEKDDAESED